jgi:hypothetical protein
MKSLYLLLLTASFVLLSACEAFAPRSNDYNNLEIIVIDQWAVQGPSPISYDSRFTGRNLSAKPPRKGTPGAEFIFYTRFEEGLTYTWTTTMGEVLGTAEDKQRSRVRIRFAQSDVGVAVVKVSAAGYKDGSKEVNLDVKR